MKNQNILTLSLQKDAYIFHTPMLSKIHNF